MQRSYVWIIYRHNNTQQYALKVYAGGSSSVDRMLAFKPYNMEKIAGFRYNTTEYITNNALTKYPRHKCRQLSHAVITNKGFITHINTSLQMMMHIVTVEIDYHFGKKMCANPQYAYDSTQYIEKTNGVFKPLVGMHPLDFKGVIRC